MKTANITLIFAASCSVLTGCIGAGRDRAVRDAISQVRETMQVAAPDLEHPEPYQYTGGSGDCALFPGMVSSKEQLRYQAEIPLPPGDNGRERQTRAVQHWIDKGGKLRVLPYDTGLPPNEVYYGDGSIMAFAMATRGSISQDAPSTFYIVVTTPCVPKKEH